jgi:hypothetical protein
MKKTVLLMALAGALSVQAKSHILTENDGDVYTYLTFEMTDGTKVSVATSSLTLTFSGNTLTVGSQTFTLSNLSKMYFSTSNESTTGIEEMATLDDENAEIYDLQGHQIQKEQMRKGVYIIKTKNRTRKILVK